MIVPGEVVPLYVPISGDAVFGPLYILNQSKELSVANEEKATCKKLQGEFGVKVTV